MCGLVVITETLNITSAYREVSVGMNIFLIIGQLHVCRIVRSLAALSIGLVISCVCADEFSRGVINY